MSIFYFPIHSPISNHKLAQYSEQMDLATEKHFTLLNNLYFSSSNLGSFLKKLIDGIF